jgi:hypothetical protein
LVELKTRKFDRPYRSDIIELSAQRIAVEQQTGQVVAGHAYVAVQRPGGDETVFHRVSLMSKAQLLKLVDRRDAILDGRAAPGFASPEALCGRCAFASRCEKFAGRGEYFRSAEVVLNRAEA